MKPTKKFLSEFKRFSDRGFAEITTSRFAPNRIHPSIAKRLLAKGWADREKIGSNIIRVTERGIREFETTTETKGGE